METGCWVRVIGLVGRADLNGTTAQLGKWQDVKGRWEVRSGSATLLVKPTNLQMLGNPQEEILSKTLLSADILLSLSGESRATRVARVLGRVQRMARRRQSPPCQDSRRSRDAPAHSHRAAYWTHAWPSTCRVRG